MSEKNGCGCGCGGHDEQATTPADLSAGRRELGLTSARPGEGTSEAELATQGARHGGSCACGRH